MKYISVKEAVEQILSKKCSVSDALSKVDPSQINDIPLILGSLKDKLSKGSMGYQIEKEELSKPCGKGGNEILKFNANGQWSMSGPITPPKDQRADKRTGANIDKQDVGASASGAAAGGAGATGVDPMKQFMQTDSMGGLAGTMHDGAMKGGEGQED